MDELTFHELLDELMSDFKSRRRPIFKKSGTNKGKLGSLKSVGLVVRISPRAKVTPLATRAFEFFTLALGLILTTSPTDFSEARGCL